MFVESSSDGQILAAYVKQQYPDPDTKQRSAWGALRCMQAA